MEATATIRTARETELCRRFETAHPEQRAVILGLLAGKLTPESPEVKRMLSEASLYNTRHGRNKLRARKLKARLVDIPDAARFFTVCFYWSFLGLWKRLAVGWRRFKTEWYL
jgi:hypothetical protein